MHIRTMQLRTLRHPGIPYLFFLLVALAGMRVGAGEPTAVLQRGLTVPPVAGSPLFFSQSADSRSLLLGNQHTLLAYDLASRRTIHESVLGAGVYLAASLSPDGRFILARRNLGRGLFAGVVIDLATGSEFTADEVEGEPASSIPVEIVDETGQRWTFRFNEEIVLLTGPKNNGLTRVALNSYHAGPIEASIAGGEVKIRWDGSNEMRLLSGNEVVERLDLRGVSRESVLRRCGGFTLPDGRLFVYGWTQEEAVVIDLFAMRVVFRGTATDFVIDQDSRRIGLRGTDGNIEIREIETGALIMQTRGDWPFALSLGGRALAVWRQATADIAVLGESGPPRRLIQWEKRDGFGGNGPQSLLFSNDGRELGVGSRHASGQVPILLQVSDGTLIEKGPEGTIGPLAYHSGEKRFYLNRFDSHMSTVIWPFTDPANDFSLDSVLFKPNSYQITGFSFLGDTRDFLIPEGWARGRTALVMHRSSATSVETVWDLPGRFEGQPTHSGNRTFVTQSGGGVLILDPENTDDPRQRVTVYPFADGSFVAVNGVGEYFAPQSLSEFFGFSLGARAYSFDQFDLVLNRPDRLLASLGAPAEMVESLGEWRKERQRKVGVASDTLPDFSRQPKCEVTNRRALAVSTREGALKVEVRGTASTGVKQWRIDVNHVPALSEPGSGGRKIEERVFSVPLASGRNKIEISVFDQNGVASTREVIYCHRRPTLKVRSALHVLAVGVGHYQDKSLFELTAAVRDAEVLGKTLEEIGKRSFEEVNVRIVTDSDATREGILSASAFLKDADVDDQVVVFFAGHGIQDPEDLSYWFCTPDIDSSRPSGRGLAYADIENFFEGVAARERLVLIDTCYAGEPYTKDLQEAFSRNQDAPLLSNGKVVARGARVVTQSGGSADAPRRPHTLISMSPGFEYFADLRRGTGATVLTASGGAEFVFSYETTKLSHGIFTHCILQALKEGRADIDGDGKIRCSELGGFLADEVASLSEGNQRTSNRGINREMDFHLATAAAVSVPMASLDASEDTAIQAGRWAVVESVTPANGGYQIEWTYDLFANPADPGTWMGTSGKERIDGKAPGSNERLALAVMRLKAAGDGSLSGSVWESNGRGKVFPVRLKGTFSADGSTFEAKAWEEPGGKLSAVFRGRLLESARPVEPGRTKNVPDARWLLRELVSPEAGGWDIAWDCRTLDGAATDTFELRGHKSQVNHREPGRNEKATISTFSLTRISSSPMLRGQSLEQSPRGPTIPAILSGAMAPGGDGFILESRDPETARVVSLLVGVRR